jgi:putative NIF3 family GTP cyclohydrolase 1 type 2
MKLSPFVLAWALASGAAAAGPQDAGPAGPLTVRRVLDRIQEHSGGRDLATWHGSTVDTVKFGDPDRVVTGIVTTFTPTMEVLRRAVAQGANLIVAHEPTFYDHRDETAWLGEDLVYSAKVAYLREHKLVVFRFHDHWHSAPGQPDGVLKGMVSGLGWERYQSTADPYRFTVPEMRLADLAREVKQKIGIRALRVVGNPELKVTGIAFAPGAAGRDGQIKALAEDAVQVLVVGESREWETVLYAVDAMGQERRKGLLLMGHDVSEELGMRECAAWLRAFVPEVKVEFVPAGEPFWLPE